MRVLRTGLTALDYIERNNKLVSALDRRHVVVSSCLIPCHPRTPDGCLQDARTLFERTFELFFEIKYDVRVRTRSDHRKQERIDPLLKHLDDRAEAIRIQRPGVVLGARISLCRCVPD